METRSHPETAWQTWWIILGCFMLILGQGLFSFYVVGDNGPPGWDYRAILDVPAQSPYALYDRLPYPQHVRGKKGE